MGLLDDAIREHLELKRRSGAAEDEVAALEQQAFGAAGTPALAPEDAPVVHDPDPVPEPDVVAVEEPVAAAPGPEAAPAPEPEAVAPDAAVDDEFWLDEPDEVPAEEALDHRRQPTQEFAADETAVQPESEFVAPDDEGEDVLEETPDFLQETPEHDRLWFEQKPPKDFDFGS